MWFSRSFIGNLEDAARVSLALFFAVILLGALYCLFFATSHTRIAKTATNEINIHVLTFIRNFTAQLS